jgi:hypothetical protein
MKTITTFFAILFTLSVSVHAQVEPAATGPLKVQIASNLEYSLRYSQNAQFGYGESDWQTNASGSLNYANGKARYPFILDYAGGYTWTLAGPPYSTGVFQHLLVSQEAFWHKWTAALSDEVSYLPEAPTTGFSGIPGTGEPIGGAGPPSTQTILTLNTHTLNNNVKGQVDYHFDSADSISMGGASDLLRYPDGNGINTDTESANAEYTRRLNGRNYFTGEYLFSHFSYPSNGFTFVTQSGLFGVRRVWNAKLTSNVSVGPQFTQNADTSLIPASSGITAIAALGYQYRFVAANVNFYRGIQGGAGYLPGGYVNAVTAGLSKQFGRDLTFGVTGAYMTTASLQVNGTIRSTFGGVQVTRRLGRFMSFFASYTAMNQTTNAALPTNTLSGLINVTSAGIEYSPRGTHFRQ